MLLNHMMTVHAFWYAPFYGWMLLVRCGRGALRRVGCLTRAGGHSTRDTHIQHVALLPTESGQPAEVDAPGRRGRGRPRHTGSFYLVGPASCVWSQTPFVVCGLRTWVHGFPSGAFNNAGVVKSKNSLMSREGSCQ